VKQLERRIIDAKYEVRTNDDGTVGVRGYAAVFDSPSHGEVIKRSAFNRSIAQKDDIRLLTNHEGVPMARTKSGTLTVGVDESGLWFDAPSLDPANPDVQRLVSAIGRGDMDQCSFAGYFTDAPVLDGLREVREVQLVDVSNVTFPWYDQTSSELTGNRAVDAELVQIRAMPADDRALLIETLNTLDPAPSGDAPEVKAVDPIEPDPIPVPEAKSYTVAEARALLGV
jgi:HK97 family phage prohead protease